MSTFNLYHNAVKKITKEVNFVHKPNWFIDLFSATVNFLFIFTFVNSSIMFESSRPVGVNQAWFMRTWRVVLQLSFSPSCLSKVVQPVLQLCHHHGLVQLRIQRSTFLRCDILKENELKFTTSLQNKIWHWCYDCVTFTSLTVSKSYKLCVLFLHLLCYLFSLLGNDIKLKNDSCSCIYSIVKHLVQTFYLLLFVFCTRRFWKKCDTNTNYL